MQSLVTHSLYFSNKKTKNQAILRGQLIFKNPNMSVGNIQQKNGKKFNTSAASDNDNSLDNSCITQLRPSPRKNLIEAKRQKLEELKMEQTFMLKTNSSLIQKHQYKMIHKNDSPPLPILTTQTQQTVVRVNLQSRTLKIKPVVKKQISQEYLVYIKQSNKKYPELKEGINLKCTYFNLRVEEQNDKLLIINFENLLLSQKRSFWENKSEMKVCNQYFLGKSQEHCDSSYCPCQLRHELRNALKILSKHYIIVLLFHNLQFSQIWNKYLLQNGYIYDGIYSMKPNTQIDIGAIKINRIIRDFNKSRINKILYLDSIDLGHNYPKLQPENFQYKLISCASDIEVNIYYFQQPQQMKYFDCRSILDLCLAYINQQNQILVKRALTVVSIDLYNVFEYYLHKQKQFQFKKNLLKQFQTISSTQEFENTNVNSVYKWVDTIRNDFIDQFKNREIEKIPQLHFLVGDIIVRNCKFREQYYNNENELDFHQKIVNQLHQVNQQLPKSFHKDTQVVNSYLCFEQ